MRGRLSAGMLSASSLAMDGEPPAIPKTDDDTALVAAAQAGDRPAFGRLYERYGRMVHGLLLAQVPPAEVEDLVQEVFLQALRKLADLRDAGAFGPWVAAIARNRATDRHRTRAPARPPRARAGGEQELPVPATAPAELEARAVLAVIDELPLAYRETLVLRLVEGMTGPEIAARTGLTPESVRVNLHRGMKKLRARLAARAGGAP
jgi:RNA polymerase sigma-70 factor (ECF subfamily)